MKKIIILLLLIAVIVGTYLLISPIAAANRIPPIANKDILLKETEELVRNWLKNNEGAHAFSGYPQQLPNNQWPESVKMLRPIRVWVEPRGVTIMTSSGGIDSSFGIFVASTELDQGTLAKTNDVLTFKKVSNRIYRYWEKE